MIDDDTNLTMKLTSALHSAAVETALRHRGDLDDDDLMTCVVTALASETVRAAILLGMDGDDFADRMRSTFFTFQAAQDAGEAIAKARDSH